MLCLGGSVTIFEHEDYKKFTVELIHEMPRNGYGQFRKIAAHLGVNSVVVTQIFKGARELTLENAFELCTYFGFSELESKYFIALVSLARSGTHKLKQHYKAELAALRSQGRDIKNRVPTDRALNEEARALFYSNWYYSAIRLASSIDGINSVSDLSEYLGLPRATVKQATEFLLRYGLMVEKKGALAMGPKLTHLESTSPLVSRHHANWRLRGMQSMPTFQADDLAYTAPMALSFETRRQVREELIQFIDSLLRRVQRDESECVTCLNIDWFDYSDRRG
jgi:uncharacterized protein (TIGR02147 family)